MSLLVLALLARPGGGSGGAEAPPLRVRAHGAALRPSDRRRHRGGPGAASVDTMLCGENQGRVNPPQNGARPPLGGGRPRNRPDDRAARAACGAKSPGPPAAATKEGARLASSLPALLAWLNSSQCCGHGVCAVRCARPRVPRPARAAHLSANTAARERRISWPTSRVHAAAFDRSAITNLDLLDENQRQRKTPSREKLVAADREVHNPFLFLPFLRVGERPPSRRFSTRLSTSGGSVNPSLSKNGCPLTPSSSHRRR